MTNGPDEIVRRSIAQSLELMRRGDANSAFELLAQVAATRPGDTEVALHQALALRVMGRLSDALRMLDEVLAREPYFFLALLSKGAVLELMGRPRRAAGAYRDALRIAPTTNVPQALVSQIDHARRVVAADASALAAHLRDAVSAARAEHRGASLARFDESLAILAGTARVHESRPVQLHVPRLPAIPFFDRELFPWLPRLEAATDSVRREAAALLDAGLPGFSPYVAYRPGTPVNQWAELNHSMRWSSLWLWRDGVRQDAAIARCPETAALLAELPLADQPGFAPTALFSALAPRTRIPPHHGSTNARLLVHLPLILPGPAGFRVGNEVRSWRIAEAWVFDDTIEHEAWNDADAPRLIMIFDIWNPLLSAAERTLITQMLTARARWEEPEVG